MNYFFLFIFSVSFLIGADRCKQKLKEVSVVKQRYLNSGKRKIFKGTGKIEKKGRLKIMSWNLEKFAFLAKERRESFDGVIELIKEESPDFLFLQEVGEKSELIKIARNKFGWNYFAFFFKGSSNIMNSALLFRKNSQFRVEYKSFSNIGFGRRMFTRDIPKALIFEKNKDRPLFGVANVHLKAPIGKDEVEVRKKRELEIDGALKAYTLAQDYFKEKGNIVDFPVIYLGDFNSDDQDVSVSRLRNELGLENIFSGVLSNQETGLRRNGEKYSSDFFLVTEGFFERSKFSLKSVQILNSEVKKREMFELSDHLPITMEIDYDLLFKK